MTGGVSKIVTRDEDCRWGRNSPWVSSTRRAEDVRDKILPTVQSRILISSDSVRRSQSERPVRKLDGPAMAV